MQVGTSVLLKISDLDRTIFATSGALQLVPIVVEGKCSFIDISMLDGCSNHHHAADVLRLFVPRISF